MKEEVMPLIIIIAILLIIYLAMRFINRKLRNRVNKSDYRRRRRL